MHAFSISLSVFAALVLAVAARDRPIPPFAYYACLFSLIGSALSMAYRLAVMM